MPEYKELQINNGKIWLNIARGEVIGQQKWSETEVHASGGGGYVGQHGGFVAPPKISSTTSEKHEFWIREDGGKETAIELSDANFPVREGQRVWIAWGGSTRSKAKSRYLFAYNYASGDSRNLLQNWWSWLYGAGLIKPPLLYRLLTTWFPLFLGLLVGFVWFPLFFESSALVVNSQDAELQQILYRLTNGNTAAVSAGMEATPQQILYRLMNGDLAAVSAGMEILSKLTNPLFIIQHWSAATSTLISKGIGNSLGSMTLVAGAIWIGGLIFLGFFGNLLFLE
ncbi:MAG: hypothetical protein ACYC0P_01915 [Thiobacillus sp.]